MTSAERNYSALLLLWSRTLPEHRLSWEEWLIRRYREKVDGEALAMPEASAA